MKYFSAWTNYDNNDVYFIGRDKGKKVKRILRGILPYLCIDRKDLTSQPVQEKIDSKYIEKTESDGRYIKLYTHFIGMITKLRDFLENKGITTYESDIPFIKRIMIDKGIKIGEGKLKWLFIDIETDDSFKDIKVGEYPILSIACIDEERNKKFFCCDNEKDTVQGFINVAKEFDVLVAWSGDSFDFPYLEKRAEKLGIKVDWREFQRVDMMFIVANRYEKLDDAGQKYLSLKKVNLEGKKIHELFKTDRQKLKEYNLRDVEIMYELEKKLNLLKLKEMLSEKSNCFLDDLSYNSVIVDMMILRKVNELKLNLRFPYKGKRKKEILIGAHIIPPPSGLQKNVIVLDFTSLYNRLLQLGLSPETFQMFWKQYNKKSVGENDVPEWFAEYMLFIRKNKLTPVIPLILSELEKERVKYKKLRNESSQGSEEYVKFDLLQNAVKVILLSFYGVMAAPHSRYYDINLASAVTGLGRYLIKESIKIIEEQGYKVLYADTDSTMVKYEGGGDIVEEGKKIRDMLNNSYKKLLARFNVLEESNKIEMKFEKVFSRLIFAGGKEGTKKRYAGLQTWEEGNSINKVTITGLEAIRTDWSKYAKSIQKKVIDLILIKEAAGEEVKKYIEECKKFVMEGKLTEEDLVIKQSLTKRPEDYDTDIPHVRVAKRMKELGQSVDVGQKIPYIYIEPDSEVIPVSEYKNNYSREYYWNNKLYSPTERIVSAVFPEIDWEALYIKKEKKKPEPKEITVTSEDLRIYFS